MLSALDGGEVEAECIGCSCSGGCVHWMELECNLSVLGGVEV